jgi:hypothetical protein
MLELLLEPPEGLEGQVHIKGAIGILLLQPKLLFIDKYIKNAQLNSMLRKLNQM